MKSPFPGMDPYIEACGLWEDFHHGLIGEIRSALIKALPDQYVVRFGERAYIVLDELQRQNDDGQSHLTQADLAVSLAHRSAGSADIAADSAVATAVEDEAVWMSAMLETEYREVFVEIRELNPDHRLVTTIEILSPSNKRYESPGWAQYLRKRQAHLQGLANFVELDLLRGGRRMPMAGKWPSGPYYVLVSRKENAARCRVWPAHLARPLPKLYVPLLPADPDIEIDLQSLVDSVYAEGRYDRDIDYNKPCRPRLNETDEQWLAQRLEAPRKHQSS